MQESTSGVIRSLMTQNESEGFEASDAMVESRKRGLIFISELRYEIAKDPDIDRNFWLEKLESLDGLIPPYRQLLQKVVDQYLDIRSRLIDFSKETTDDLGVAAHFGIEPKGDFSVDYLPCAVLIKLTDPSDYQNATGFSSETNRGMSAEFHGLPVIFVFDDRTNRPTNHEIFHREFAIVLGTGLDQDTISSTERAEEIRTSLAEGEKLDQIEPLVNDYFLSQTRLLIKDEVLARFRTEGTLTADDFKSFAGYLPLFLSKTLKRFVTEDVPGDDKEMFYKAYDLMNKLFNFDLDDRGSIESGQIPQAMLANQKFMDLVLSVRDEIKIAFNLVVAYSKLSKTRKTVIGATGMADLLAFDSIATWAKLLQRVKQYESKA